MNLTKLSSIAMVCIAALSGSASAAENSELQLLKKTTIGGDCQPLIHYPMGMRPASPSATTYAIKLLPPQDSGFHEMMGGDMSQISMESFHNATGTMFVVANTNGSTDITFDFYGLLPLGVYSLWNVTDANYDEGTFADGPLPDECSTLIGVAFGFLPARNAAQLDPVEALARE